jgi:hypothetical protein
VNIPTTICTLFEGNYHYGVGALANSLYHHGFRGNIWVGYRGDLPSWAKPLYKKERYQVFEVAKDCNLHFLPLDTNYHLTNYKPTFMLHLWDQYGDQVDGLCYIDPDIVLKCEWSFFDNWLDEHIALCEDINSPLNTFAPERIAWQKVMKRHNINLPSNINQYVNGGFVGLKKINKPFVQTWKQLLDIIAQETESLDVSFLPNAKGEQSQRPQSALFYATEQDALNCATMLHENKVAIANRSAMDFGRFGTIMSHAIGGHKPWKMNYIKEALDGRRAGIAHKLYWNHVLQPIQLYTDRQVRQMQRRIKLASLISNFYSR